MVFFHLLADAVHDGFEFVFELFVLLLFFDEVPFEDLVSEEFVPTEPFVLVFGHAFCDEVFGCFGDLVREF